MLKTGDHTLIIGEIVAAYALDQCFDSVYDLRKFSPSLHLGKNYFTTCVKRRKEPKLPHS